MWERFYIIGGLLNSMALYFIGLGLNDEKDISLKGLEAVKRCEVIYLEHYTSVLNRTTQDLEKFYGKKIILAPRTLVEQEAEATILKDARERDTAFLVVGDPFCATTHIDLFLRARKEGIPCQVVHNTSVISAVGITGLQVYKFGKTTSIPFHHEQVDSPYEVMKENMNMGMHTLFLLDLDPENGKYMTVNDAIAYLLSTAKRKRDNTFNESILCVGCARLGSENQLIKAGTSSQLLKHDFGKPVHCFIVPSKLHFMEEEALSLWK